MESFKEYTEKNEKAVSFDFDDTIYMLNWLDEENDFERDAYNVPIGRLNKKIAAKIKQYSQDGYLVYVITSRYDIWKEDTETFLKDNDLLQYIENVIFTNGAWKANTCKRMGVSVHYDDDIKELKRLRYKNIVPVRVKHENI